MKRFFLLAVVAIYATSVGATTSMLTEEPTSQSQQNQSINDADSISLVEIQQIEVNGVRAKSDTPIAFSAYSREQIDERNYGKNPSASWKLVEPIRYLFCAFFSGAYMIGSSTLVGSVVPWVHPDRNSTKAIITVIIFFIITQLLSVNVWGHSDVLVLQFALLFLQSQTESSLNPALHVRGLLSFYYLLRGLYLWNLM